MRCSSPPACTGAGLSIYYLGFGAFAGFGLGVLAAAGLAALFGLFALRTSGVSFLIVTMMFGQACYLAILYFNEITLGIRASSLRSAPGGAGGAGCEVQRGAGGVRGVLPGEPRHRALAAGAGPGRDPGERGAHPPARLRHLGLQAVRAGGLGGDGGRRGCGLRAALLLRGRLVRGDPALHLPAAVDATGRGRHTLGPLLGTGSCSTSWT